jgi:hypothetical protein
MSLVVSDVGKQDLIAPLSTYLAANAVLRLFQNNHVPNHADTAASYTEATFAGYAAINLTTWGTPYLSADFHAWIDETLRTFTSTGSSPANTIYGYFVTKGSGDLLFAEAAAVAVTINASGQAYSVLPRFSLTSEF